MILLLLVLVVACLPVSVRGDQYGDFSYTDHGTHIEVIGYPATATGPVEIPATINGKPVTHIGDWAFESCSGLASVTIPSTVTHIGRGAFTDCGGLTSMTIPPSVISVGGFAFGYCDSLTSIIVAEGNPNYSSQEGVLFDSPKARLVQYPGGRAGDYTIPGTVTVIGPWAFGGCGGLTSVVIPASVISIEYRAFESCSGLTDVTIPASVLSIGDYVFRWCNGLASVTVPASVTSIGYNAFHLCENLTAIMVDPVNPNYSSRDGVLFDKSQSVLLEFPCGWSGSYTIPSSVASIGMWAFDGCSGLTSMTIPASVTSIGDSAFSGCHGLTSVTIPASVTHIGSGAFFNCSGLTLAVFLGDAPVFYWSPFEDAALGFTVYYFDGKAGFTSPTWTTPGGTNYPAVNMGTESPTKPWLVTNGFHFDADMQSDPNGDGVRLLLAYALDLDPNDNLAGRMPKPAFTGNQMGLTFHASSPGITYSVQTSENLVDWTTEGVTLGAPDPQGLRTATVDRSKSRRFLRLVVTD